MNSRYKQLVDKLGEEGAKLEMSRVSKLNTAQRNRGFAGMDKDKLKQVTSRGGQTTAQRYFKKDENRQSGPEILPLGKN